MKDGIFCSVVLSSRNRPKLLKYCILEAYKLAKFKDNLEIIVRIDNDDLQTLNLFLNDKDLKAIKNLRVYSADRTGFDYLWMNFRDMFGLSKGSIILPISDDLIVTKKDWDRKLLHYKDQEVAIGRFARFALTKKLIEKDDYVRNWTYSTLRGDQDIWRYTKKKRLFIKLQVNLYRKELITSRQERRERWKLKDQTILDNLKWQNINITKQY